MAATMQQQQQQAPAAGAAPGQQPGPNYPMASLYVGDLAPEVGMPGDPRNILISDGPLPLRHVILVS